MTKAPEDRETSAGACAGPPPTSAPRSLAEAQPPMGALRFRSRWEMRFLLGPELASLPPFPISLPQPSRSLQLTLLLSAFSLCSLVAVMATGKQGGLPGHVAVSPPI